MKWLYEMDIIRNGGDGRAPRSEGRAFYLNAYAVNSECVLRYVK